MTAKSLHGRDGHSMGQHHCRSPHGYIILTSGIRCALMRVHLIRLQGFPATSILKEVSSFDTIGNGYYALTIHSIPRGWRNVAMITSEFHMPRSKVIMPYDGMTTPIHDSDGDGGDDHDHGQWWS